MQRSPAEILIKAREGKGYTQKNMAGKLGISPRQYQKYESGTFPKYKTEVVKDIDRLLHTNLYEFIYEQNVPHENIESKDKPFPVAYNPEKAVGEITEKLIKMEARITVLTVSLVHSIANQTGRPAASVSTELQKSIDEETDRLLDELRKRG